MQNVFPVLVQTVSSQFGVLFTSASGRLFKKSFYECRELGKKTIYKDEHNKQKRAKRKANEDKSVGMWRLVKLLLFLVGLSGLLLVVYAYMGPIFFPNDFAAPSSEITQPIVLGTE